MSAPKRASGPFELANQHENDTEAGLAMESAACDTDSASTPSHHLLNLPAEMRVRIYENLNRETISRLRLTNKQVEAEVSPYLFEVLTLGLRTRSFIRLMWVAAVPKFARSVKKLVWETAQYTAQTANGTDLCENDSIGKLLYRLHTARDTQDPDTIMVSGNPENWDLLTEHERKAWVQRGLIGLGLYRFLQEDEADLLGNVGRAMLRVSASLCKFTALRSIAITSWSETHEEAFFDKGSLTGSNKLMPPPFLAGGDPFSAWEVQNFAFSVLMNCLSTGKNKIESLEIMPSPAAFLSPLTKAFTFPAMVPEFGVLDELDHANAARDEFMANFRTLKTLNLSMTNIRGVLSPTILDEKVANVKSMRDFFGALETLDTLTLGLRAEYFEETTAVSLEDVFGNHKFARLRHIRLADFWLEPTELCDFLLKHASTLETIALININLGGIGNLPLLRPGVVKLPEAEDEQDDSSDPTEHPGWEEVAEACTALRQLRSLRIESASVGEYWTPVAQSDMTSLEQLGMGSRENASRLW
ncbi:hypothetical protein LTR56_025631 [Elasticomyces elasticus]|nr:hypothetical protein LTR56_025631 [Elasticomyces elasticus]KAK3632172.1 hypothetical protein LTR22_020683 [Elasticomyces elasticus]KAK4904209.1 hypothetical protein LTR49_026300 [Elasticomyces elasticus]KAK5739464.1 hypothetical protein LTS12_025286 [Elasticomyces elasticus]